MDFETWLKIFIDSLTVQLVTYVTISGLAYLALWKWARKWSETRKTQKMPFDSSRVRAEFLWSLSACWVNALVVSAFFVSPLIYKTKFYLEIQDKGWLWYVGTVIFLILFEDVYFYWIHRLHHHRWFFPKIHALHHLSHNPSPLAGFSIHPLESMTYAIIAVIVPFLFPIHHSALAVWAAISMAANTMGHSGIEFHPESWKRHRLLKWINRPTYHNLHHSHVYGNFGYYFIFWDVWFGTFAGDEENFDQMNKKSREEQTNSRDSVAI